MKNESTALSVIDMQQGMKEPAAGERNNIDAERSIQNLLTAWRDAGWPIVHVRHILRNLGSPFWLGQPGAGFQPELISLDKEHVVAKNGPDAFTQNRKSSPSMLSVRLKIKDSSWLIKI